MRQVMVADTIRDCRLMKFTALLRLYDVVSIARLEQCHKFFVDYENMYPLIDGYTRTGKDIDFRNMKMYIEALKDNLRGYYEDVS